MSKFNYSIQAVTVAINELYEDGLNEMADRLLEEINELKEMEHRMEGLDK